MKSVSEDYIKGVVVRFNENKDAIKPIIDKHFEETTWGTLLEMAETNQGAKLFSSLNNIWFLLPDHIYNIIENPPGWNEFLYIIEV